MLQSFRRARSSWIVLGILGLVMIAFIVTGFGTGGGGIGDLGGGPDRLVTVGDETIAEQDMINRMNDALKIAQRDRPELDMAQFVQMGAFDDLLRQEILNSAQIAFAKDQHVAASKRLIDGEIAGEPAFQNAAGQFDEKTFRATITQAGVRESDLRREVTLAVLRRQMLRPIAQGARPPSNLVNFYATLLLESRTGAVGAVPYKAVGPGSEPTEPEIAAYFKAHLAKYRIPERRVLRYALFGWSDVVNTVGATDAEIEAAYRQAGALYGPRETRIIVQLTLPDQAAANSFVAKVKAGKGFAAAAGEAGFGPGDIVHAEGMKDDVGRKVAPQVAEAAFKATQGATVGPIRSALGWHVARVEKVTVVPAKPLAAVRNELASKIQQQKAVDALDSLITRIEDSIADGASFDEVVRANNLRAVETQPVTQAGEAPGTAYQLPVEARALLKPGFELSTDDDPQVETITAGQRYGLLVVSRSVDPADPPLALVHDRIKADMVTERSAQRTKKLTDQIVARINAGTPIRQAFAGAGVPLPPVQAVTMRRADAVRAANQLPPPVRALFGLSKGKASAMPTPDNQGWFVVTVENVTPGNPKDAGPIAADLKQQFGPLQTEEYMQQLAQAMEREVGVKRNEAAIGRLKRRLQTGGAQ